MATLVFSAIGSALGGPMGGMLGGFIGREVDSALFGSASRKGPRLDDLRVTTSSYGSAIPRLFGAIRAPGTVIWATDMVEHSTTQGGGKGSPSVTTYSYSISLAVALSSRPITGLGRIWADGNLLRGAEGDLKVGGQMRVYSGHGDHAPDPLIASAEGIYAPAFRGTAYVVFEDLDLTPFGNRIPALSFEVLADDGPLDLAILLDGASSSLSATSALPGLGGFSHDSDNLGDLLAVVDAVYPLVLDASADVLSISDAEALPPVPPLLPLPAITADEDSFGAMHGTRRQRHASDTDLPVSLRYYDSARDYLAGVQRAEGRAMAGREQAIEFPGALAASDARRLANRAAARMRWSKESMAWRLAELDPALHPGSVVRAPGHDEHWRVATWEWRASGVELELRRLPRGPAKAPVGDAGRPLLPLDRSNGPTRLVAFALPFDGSGDPSLPRIMAAPSSAAPGWRGAQLFAWHGETLDPVAIARRRAVIGETLGPLAPSPAHLLERQANITVRLLAPDFALVSAPAEALALGANRALVGSELIQFAQATPLGNGEWRLTGLLRGRGGTEALARAGHGSGAPFVLLDHRLVALDPALTGDTADTQIAAWGLADSEPISAPLINTGITLRPLCPVHPRVLTSSDGALTLGWTRRARGAWDWADGVDAPLIEESEAYRVGLGPPDAPLIQWDVHETTLSLDAPLAAQIALEHNGHALWVRQIGRHTLSDPLHLLTLT